MFHNIQLGEQGVIMCQIVYFKINYTLSFERQEIKLHIKNSYLGENNVIEMCFNIHINHYPKMTCFGSK